MAKINDKDSKKIKDLLQKVKSLADKGDAGERDNAKKILNKLLLKDHILKFDISKYKKRTFKLADFQDCKTIMAHCILDTLSNASIDGSKSKKELYVKLTDEQYIDVCQKFNHYYIEFVKQREAFIKAFIIKNNLGIVDGEECFVSEDIDNIKNIYGSISANRHNQKKLN